MDHSVPIFVTKQANKQQGQLPYQIQMSAHGAVDKQGSAYYQVVSPLIYCLRLFGEYPYTIRDGLPQVRLRSWWTLYSILMVSVQISVRLITSHSVYVNAGDVFDSQLSASIHVVVMVFQSCMALSVWFVVPDINVYFSKWACYQEELRLCGIILSTKLKKWVMVYLLFSIIYTSCVSYNQALLESSNVHIPVLLMFHASFIITAILWLISGQFLRYTAALLLKRMRKAASCRDPLEMAACRKAWLTLADLTVGLGNILGPMLIGFLLIACLVIIYSSYQLMFIYVAGSQSLNQRVPSKFFFISVEIAIVIVLCEFGYRCTNAVGYDTLQELLRIDPLRQEKHFQLEVNMFINTVSLRYPDMKLCGFVTLNRKLLVSLLSGAITYLIVLVQFRTSEQ